MAAKMNRTEAGYAGHMAKANRTAVKHLSDVDIVIIVLDARLPLTTLRPFSGKRVLERDRNKVFLVLNKEDLADPEATGRWIRKFEKDGFRAAAVNSKNRQSVKKAVSAILASRPDTGRKASYFPRAMMAGIPNVGKSSFINAAAGESKAHVGNKAGITRGKQWIVTDSLELLDMPGILQPDKLSDSDIVKLACIGAVNDENTDPVENALFLYGALGAEKILEFYGADTDGDTGFEAVMTAVARKRAMLLKGGEADIERACLSFVNDFRALKFGRITLEEPSDE